MRTLSDREFEILFAHTTPIEPCIYYEDNIPDQLPSPCACQPSWPWKGKTYEGCDPTHPDDHTPWCYVKDASCKSARESDDHPGSSWRYCSPGGCPGSSVATQHVPSVTTVDLLCMQFAPLDEMCNEVQSILHKLGTEGKLRMVELSAVSPILYHSSCKHADQPKQWWESGENRPAKAPKNKCLQGSSCLSIDEARGPKFVAAKEFCGGKGVQFKYAVDSSAKEKILEFTDRQSFKPLGASFTKHRQQLSEAYGADLITQQIDASFAEGKQVSGETLKFIMDMFKIPGYFASENAEVCLENNLIKKLLKEGAKIFEDDHKSGNTVW